MNEQAKAQQDRIKYEELKEAIKNLEEKNFSRLILFHSGGKEWYKMGGNSLLIYKNKIVPQLKIRTNVQPDTDYTKCIFEEGVISFRGVESLKERLEKAEKLKKITRRGEAVIFDLNLVVTEEEMQEYREELKDERERAVAVLRADIVLSPEIYGKLKYIQRRVFETVRKMSVYERSYNGMVMTEYSRMLTKTYMMMNNNMMDVKEGWKEILRLTNLLIIEITFVTELKVIRSDVGASIGAELVDVKKMVEKEIGRME